MSNTFQIITDVKNFLAKDELTQAIELLSNVFKNDKILDEIIIQSARKHRIEKEIRLGVVSFQDATMTKNQITDALISICRDLEPEPPKLGLDEPIAVTNNNHFLREFPRGPMVDGYLISEKIIEAYAKLISPQQALMFINKANSLRKEADPNDDTVTILEPYTLLSPTNSRPLEFWLDAFHEASLHGPRMLAALLFILPADQFSSEAKNARQELINYLKNHK